MSEPSNSELQRVTDRLERVVTDGFNQINGRLDRMATKEDVRDDIQAVNAALAEEKAVRAADVVEERKQRERAVGDLRKEMQTGIDKLWKFLWGIATLVLLPTAFFIADILIRKG